MNKYLMMTAAAVFGTTASALAQQPGHANEIQFLSSNGGSYCDGLSFYKSPYSGIKIQLGSHLLTGCAESNTEIAGQMGKKSVNLVENWQGPTTFLYDISKPIKTGGTYQIWACDGQSSCFEVNSGTYKLGYNGASHGRPKSAAKVAAIIAARKAAHH